jgi:hypothetical protein
VSRDRYRSYAIVLWLLTFLFFLRVLTQALVAFFEIDFLPSMEEWTLPSGSPFSTSGLIPYPILLFLQCLILMVQVKICFDFSREYGLSVIPRAWLGMFLRWFSTLYFISMILRYAITMTLYPERRWLGSVAIIFFHFVLAGFLLVLGHFHTKRSPSLIK